MLLRGTAITRSPAARMIPGVVWKTPESVTRTVMLCFPEDAASWPKPFAFRPSEGSLHVVPRAGAVRGLLPGFTGRGRDISISTFFLI